MIVGAVSMVIIVICVVYIQNKQKGASPMPPRVQRPIFPSALYTAQPVYRGGIGAILPMTLPIYNAGATPQTITVASALAQRVGIQGAPEEVASTLGRVFVWSGNDQNVVANEGLINVAYSGPGIIKGVLNKPIESYTSLARQFIEPLRLTSPPIQLIQKRVRLFNPNVGGANEILFSSQATSVQIDYQYVVNGVPVYTGTTANPSVSIRLNEAGDVLSFTAILLPTLTPSGGTVSLSYDGVTKKLVDGEGVLADIRSGATGDQLFYFSSPPNDVNIIGSEVAYYYSPKQQSVVPIYVIRGTGAIDKIQVETTTLISGVK